MWILLTTDLPVQPSPPALSIFYTDPWPMKRNRFEPWASRDLRKTENEALREAWDDHDALSPHAPLLPEPDGSDETGSKARGLQNNMQMRSPNWKGARRLNYEGHTIRVFPHEFSALSESHLKGYVTESHDWVASGLGESELLKKLKDGVFYCRQRGIPEGRALAMVLEGLHDPEDDASILPVGHYEINNRYRAGLAMIFGVDELSNLPKSLR